MNQVLVVDDFEGFRRFLCSQLQKMSGFVVVGECSDGADAVDKARRLVPDLILLDVGLPIMDGIRAAREIRQHVPDSIILFVSANRSMEIAEEALRNGGRGFVVKSDVNTELWPAIEAVLRGETYVSSAIAAQKAFVAG